MDPSAVHNRVVELALKVELGEADEAEIKELAESLDLNDWLCGGGFRPSEWVQK